MAKKILYFIPEFPKLTETFIAREVSKLVELGNLDVQILSVKKASGAMPENLVSRTTFRDINIFDFFLGLEILVKNLKVLTEVLKIVTNAGSFKLALNAVIYFIKSIGYAHVINKYKVDHLHSHFLSYPSTIVMFVSLMLKLPFSISGHAKDVFVEGEYIQEKVRRAKFISICNTYAWSKCIELARGENSSNVKKIYHGMELEKALATPPTMKKPTRPMIFCGSRLVEKKGLKYLIEASKILRDEGIDHEVHIVGPGDMYKQLIETVAFLNLRDRVYIPGGGKGVSNLEIMEYFKVADIFAHPSIETGTGDVDGVPTFVIESAMAKVPVVTTTAGSITDLINQDTGILVTQRDAYSLADGIKKLINSESLRKSLAESAYLKAKSMFDLNINTKQLEELFIS